MHRNDKQNVLKRAILATALASVFFAAPLGASAAGMGKITVLSALGQPLRAELDITATREELASLAARVAPVEVFRQANVEYASVLSAVRFSLDKRPDGKPYFKIQTDRAVNDPFIDFLVELSWSSGRLVREYAFLLDPPELKASSESVVAVVAAPGTESVMDKTASSITSTVGTATEPVQVKKTPLTPTLAGKPKVASDVALPVEDTRGEANIRKVKRGDTLGKIAAESATAGVTLDQMLVALFNSNRDAFIGGNMNRLRAGKILNIPDAEKVAAINAGEARKIVVVQATAFNAYRSSLAALAANQVPLEQKTQQSSSGKITPKVEEKASVTSGLDKLQVSSSEAKAKTSKGKLSEEDVVARDKALKEANSRITELEKNLTDLKKLAELKNQAATVKPAETPAPAKKGITVEAQTPATPAVAAKPETPAVPATATTPDANGKTQPKPKKKFIPPPPQPEPSFIEDNPLLVYGGGGALAAVLGFLGFRTWKRKRDADSDQGITVSDLAASSVFGMAANESHANNAALQPDFGHSTIEAVDTGRESVDPVQEAEVYMAYGRDGQAEEILVDAMRKDPGNLAVYLKLLEIYAGRKSLPQFSELIGELHMRTGGNGSEWDQAVALGRSLDPGNPLYGDSGTAELESESSAVESDSASQSMDATIVMRAPPLQEAPVDAVPAIVDEVPSTLDFDMDLGNTATAVPVQESALTMTASDLDFDLDLDSDEKSTEEAAQSGGLDINIDTSDKSDNTLDFDFDLGTSESGSINQPVPPPVDLSSINLDLGESAVPVGTANAGDSAEVATKLELAHAYEEMGDREGARELLQEVLVEGSPAQQETARNKLAQLG